MQVYKYEMWSFDLVWQSVSVIVNENEGEDEEARWQPILATSLQQSLKEWYFWSQ